MLSLEHSRLELNIRPHKEYNSLWLWARDENNEPTVIRTNQDGLDLTFICNALDDKQTAKAIELFAIIPGTIRYDPWGDLEDD
jgi:hypothetical protein